MPLRPEAPVRGLIAAGLVVLLIFLAGGCGTAAARPRVRLHALDPALAATTPASPEAASPEAARAGERRPLRVAVAAVLSPEETLASYQEFFAFLKSRLGRSVEIAQRPTYAEVNDLVRSGDVDMALVCTYAYVEGKRDRYMELLVAPQIRGEVAYYSYIIVRRESSIAAFADLRGRAFAFSDPMSNSGRLYPEYLLAEMGETPERFFRKVIFTYSHDRSIKAVAEGLVDGAAVDSAVFDHALQRRPGYRERLKVIHRSEAFGPPPVVVATRIDPELRDRLQAILLGMHEDEAGREILKSLLIDRFVKVDDAVYDRIRAMAARVRGK